LDETDSNTEKTGNDPSRDRPEEIALLNETGEILVDALSDTFPLRKTAAKR